MSADTMTRPLPVFRPADYIGPAYAGEISVECSACPNGWTEAQPDLDKAMNSFEQHLNEEHIGFAITQAWQAAEVLADDYRGDAEAEHVWQWIVDHLDGLPNDTTPQYWLASVMQAASSLSSYADDLVNRAARLKAKMPLDPEAEMV